MKEVVLDKIPEIWDLHKGIHEDESNLISNFLKVDIHEIGFMLSLWFLIDLGDWDKPLSASTAGRVFVCLKKLYLLFHQDN